MDSWTEESHAEDDLGFEFETLKLIGLLLCLAIGTIAAVTYQCLADQRRMRNNNNTQQQQNEQQPQGLQINGQLIPVVEYSKESKDGICAVCLCEFKVGEAIRVLPECMHLFHAGCVDLWLISHSNCPLCRTDIEPRRVVLSMPQFSGGTSAFELAKHVWMDECPFRLIASGFCCNRLRAITHAFEVLCTLFQLL